MASSSSIKQPSLGSAGVVLTPERELRHLKEAIVDLYLAIKIRSTDEVRHSNIY
jgi:hypothetical protein